MVAYEKAMLPITEAFRRFTMSGRLVYLRCGEFNFRLTVYNAHCNNNISDLMRSLGGPIEPNALEVVRALADTKEFFPHFTALEIRAFFLFDTKTRTWQLAELQFREGENRLVLRTLIGAHPKGFVSILRSELSVRLLSIILNTVLVTEHSTALDQSVELAKMARRYSEHFNDTHPEW